MKFIKTITLLLISSLVLGQNSKEQVQTKMESTILNIKSDNKCNIKDLKSIFSNLSSRNKKKKLNKFVTTLFECNPEKLDFEFHQELVDLSYTYGNYLNKTNHETLNHYYKIMRIRFFKIKERQQKILLTKAKLQLQSQNLENGYATLTEVMKIYESNIRTKDERGFDNFTNGINMSYEYAYQAYIVFLKYLSVDDFRFKMLAKNTRYKMYINNNNQYPYKIINDKLAEAGYKKMKPKVMRGARIDIESIKLKEEKENEEFKNEYDWIKE